MKLVLAFDRVVGMKGTQEDLRIYEPYMLRAIQLAELGRGKTHPNPVVGCVIVKNGEIVGEGYHEYAGGPHAEVVALRHAGELARGATLIVTLEPCNHYGRTPPCTEAIIEAGIAKVVCSVVDPNPLNAGGGALRLRQSGVEVDVGLLAERVAKQNEVFLKHISSGRPFVLVKVAMSLDGKIAEREGVRTRLTCWESSEEVHRLRSEYDAILIGVGTVLVDDPLLTARPSFQVFKNPIRVILDPKARTPIDSLIVKTAGEVKTVVFTSGEADSSKTEALENAGVEVVTVPSPEGLLDLGSVLDELAARGVSSVMVEGGRKIISSFINAELVDKFLFFACPSLIGGSGLDLADSTLIRMAKLDITAVRRLGDDLEIEAYPKEIKKP